MADIDSYIKGNSTKVGPAPSTGSGSALDNQRKVDYGDFSTVSPKEVRAAMQQSTAKAEPLSNVEKFERFTNAARSAIAVKEKGQNVEIQQAAAIAAREQYNAAPRDERQPQLMRADVQERDSQIQDVWKVNERNADEAAFQNSVGPIDQLQAALVEMTGTGSLVRYAIDQYEGARDFQVDPLFNPMENREEWASNRPADEQEWLSDSHSADELQWKLGRLQETKANLKILGAHGVGAATFFSLGAGVLDPVGWAAGMGVGKAAQLARVPSEVSRISMLGSAVEGVVGNTLVTATMDAAGDYVTPSDYAYGAAFGVLFGAGGAAIANRLNTVNPEGGAPARDEGARAADDATQQAQDIHDGELRFMKGLWEEAQARAGEGATSDQIGQVAINIQYERAQALRNAAHEPMPDNARLMPDIEELVGQNTDEGNITGTLTSGIESQFRPLERRLEVGARYGVTPDTVPDNAQRLIDTEMLTRMEEQAPTFDEERLQVLSRRLPNALQSTAMLLARSRHPAMRWVAANLLEQPTQAAGPRTSAAVEHAIREREYNAPIAQFQEVYTAWRNQNGGSTLRDTFTRAAHWEEFNRAVSNARRDRALGVPSNEHPLVARAADIMDEAYTRLRQDQISSKTLGSEHLRGIESSRGYFSRVIDARWLVANAGRKNAVRAEIERQLGEAWQDFSNGRQFAKETAARYIDRSIREAQGGGMVPVNVFDPHAAPNLRDALAQGTNLSAKDIDAYVDRLGRGGAKHTRGRLDLDTSTVLRDETGAEFSMSDAFVQDQVALYRSQARRVNGEVTLTRRGIQGRKGLMQLRDLAALRSTPGNEVTAAELRAYDQIAAEFSGGAFKEANRHLDNLRILTAVSRLGQAIMPQIAETANLAATLGVQSALRMVRDLPRLVQDVRRGRTNELLDSLEIPGGRIGDEHAAVMPWQDLDNIELAGRDSPGMLDRVLRASSNAQSLMTGFRYLHAAQVRGASEQILHRVMRQVRDGGDDAALRSMGISPELQAQLRDDLPNIARFDEDGRLTALDIRQTASPEAALALQQAVERGAKQIIQGTFIGERGAYMHDSFLRVLTQFRSFSIIAMDKQFSRVAADRGTAKALGLLLGQMSFAVPIHLARVNLNASTMEDSRREQYLETQLAPGMLARATLNYASLGGLAGDILDAGAALGGLEMSGVRSGQSSFSGNIPAIGYADGLVRGITNKDMSALVKSLPGGNTVFLTPVANGLHELQAQ